MACPLRLRRFAFGIFGFEPRLKGSFHLLGRHFLYDADAVEVDVDKLYPLTVNVPRLEYDDLFDEFVYQLRSISAFSRPFRRILYDHIRSARIAVIIELLLFYVSADNTLFQPFHKHIKPSIMDFDWFKPNITSNYA